MDTRKPKIDGDRLVLQIKLPPILHLAAFVGVMGIVGVGYFRPDALTPLLGSLGVLIAFYSAFYARQAIMTSHHNAVVSATIDFSRGFGDSRVQSARWALGAEYEALSSSVPSKLNDEQKIKEIGGLLSKKIGDSKPEAKEGASAPPAHTLYDDAVILLDYCEDLAVGVERGVLDEPTARDLLCSAICQFWTYLHPFVDNQRAKRGSKTLYIKFQELADRWKDG
ncbi:MAG: DUF4760 domain-containing protein [Planctomycetaceae bacterium]|nr:DUF4760 domain-containing protein [Planctomycetaceae bacterium]